MAWHGLAGTGTLGEGMLGLLAGSFPKKAGAVMPRRNLVLDYDCPAKRGDSRHSRPAPPLSLTFNPHNRTVV